MFWAFPKRKTTGRRPKTPPKKSYSECFRRTQIRSLIWRSSSFRPPEKIHPKNLRPELSAFLANFLQHPWPLTEAIQAFRASQKRQKSSRGQKRLKKSEKKRLKKSKKVVIVDTFLAFFLRFSNLFDRPREFFRCFWDFGPE